MSKSVTIDLDTIIGNMSIDFDNIEANLQNVIEFEEDIIIKLQEKLRAAQERMNKLHHAEKAVKRFIHEDLARATKLLEDFQVDKLDMQDAKMEIKKLYVKHIFPIEKLGITIVDASNAAIDHSSPDLSKLAD